MTPRLAQILKQEADLESALRIVRQDRRDEERRQSEALGYRVILRGPQLLEAMGRRVA
jgi:hypothetical protein